MERPVTPVRLETPVLLELRESEEPPVTLELPGELEMMDEPDPPDPLDLPDPHLVVLPALL